jgi:hypothetical protein
MAPYEHKNLALKYDFKNRTIGLLLGFTGLIFALCFVGFFVYINRAEVAGFTALFGAIAFLVSKFMNKK